MTWLYVPGTLSNSAPAQEASDSASNSPCPERAASLTWRGKPLPPQLWLRAWKRVIWLPRLSGLTSPPSMLEHGVTAFIASLPAIHVSPTASPEKAPAPTTNVSSSTRCSASSMNAGLSVSSARTFRGIATDNSPLSSRHWNEWATALRREFSARPKLATAMDDSDLSLWPTARTSRGGYTRDRGDPAKTRPTLEGLASSWATPLAGDAKRGADRNRANRRHQGPPLSEQAGDWSTPSAHDGRRPGADLHSTQGRNLSREAANWPTPAGSETRQGYQRRPHGMASLQCQQSLTTIAIDLASLPDPATLDGVRSLIPIPFLPLPLAISTCGRLHAEILTLRRWSERSGGAAGWRGTWTRTPRRRLNAKFVELLMRWPIGWSGFGSLETGLTPWLHGMRGFISTLATARGASARQGTLL